MTMTINGSGTITGLSAGGLPNATIQTEDIVDLAVTPAKMSQKLTSGTAVASTSGTSIDFTSIPSWVKRITVMFSGVSTNGTDAIWIQLGDAGGIETTSYVSVNTSQSGTLTTSTSAFIAGTNNPATDTANGVFTILQISTNTWVQSGIFAENGTSRVYTGAGSKTLSDTLTQVRITTAGGTNTFDAGSINIMYE